jgi:hypothetical protein
MINQPFQPWYGSGQALAVTASNQTLTLKSVDSKQVRLQNIGTQPIYVRISDAADATVASTADFVIKSNDVPQVVSKGLGNKLSVIAPATGSTLYVMEGDGF